MHKPVVLLISILQVALFVLSGIAVNEAAAAQEPASHVAKTLQVDGVSYSLEIEIAAAAAGDDTLARGVYVFRLKCSADISCGLERITLNECALGKDGAPAFSPRVDSWSTWSGQLVVRQTGSHEIELTVYQGLGKKLPAKMILTFASDKSPPFKELADLKTTGFINLRSFPNIDTRIEYVPVQNDRKKTLDCPVSLRGLSR